MTFSPADSTLDALNRHGGLFIGGEVRAGSSGRRLENLNPSTGLVLSEVSLGNEADIDAAVASARLAFDNGSWRRLSPAERSRVLLRIADLIEEYGDEIAELEMLESGKLLGAARNGEVPFAAECFRYFAGWCSKIEGRTKRMSFAPADEFHVYTLREPIGVVGLIVPYNGSLVQTSWKLAPALAAGCCAVVKPDEKTPTTSLRLAELALEAGVPPGVFNVVNGTGQAAGAALVRHKDVRKVSFTGSTRVGREVGRAALENFKKVTLELGGKSPVIVLADADLDTAIPGAADAIFSNAGQVCIAGSRLYVEEPVYDDVVSGIVDYARGLKVGPAHDKATQMGPLISAAHRDKVVSAVKLGKKEGATIAAGGRPIEIGGGFYMEPTVLTNVSQSMSVVQDELFGPVVTVTCAANLHECIDKGNDSRYGLAASIWTRDVSKAHRIAADMQAGLVWVNCHGIPDMAVPFGGFKESGWGRENGLEGLLAYTELKSVVCKL